MCWFQDIIASHRNHPVRMRQELVWDKEQCTEFTHAFCAIYAHADPNAVENFRRRSRRSEARLGKDLICVDTDVD